MRSISGKKINYVEMYTFGEWYPIIHVCTYYNITYLYLYNIIYEIARTQYCYTPVFLSINWIMRSRLLATTIKIYYKFIIIIYTIFPVMTKPLNRNYIGRRRDLALKSSQFIPNASRLSIIFIFCIFNVQFNR